jgi:hypothetical protein
MNGTDRPVSSSTKSDRGRSRQPVKRQPVIERKKALDAWKRPSPRGGTADKLIGQLVPELNADPNDKAGAAE